VLERNECKFDTQRLYIELDEIEKITVAVLWEDFKTYFKQVRKFDRIASIADSSIVETLSTLCKPFVTGQLKFFDGKEAQEASDWVMESDP
jgi:hypothetical protein